MTGLQRIAIIGCGGAGKSTLALQLGGVLGLPVVHLDVEHWRPGWVETPRDEWARRVVALASAERWIIDGNYGGTMGIRLDAADTVVFLDLPRRVCLWRVVKRRLLYRGRSRPDMAAGCPEKLDLGFLRWIWNYPRDRRPEILALLREHRPGRTVVVLRSPAEVRRYLRSLRACEKSL